LGSSLCRWHSFPLDPVNVFALGRTFRLSHFSSPLFRIYSISFSPPVQTMYTPAPKCFGQFFFPPILFLRSFRSHPLVLRSISFFVGKAFLGTINIHKKFRFANPITLFTPTPPFYSTPPSEYMPPPFAQPEIPSFTSLMNVDTLGTPSPISLRHDLSVEWLFFPPLPSPRMANPPPPPSPHFSFLCPPPPASTPNVPFSLTDPLPFPFIYPRGCFCLIMTLTFG